MAVGLDLFSDSCGVVCEGNISHDQEAMNRQAERASSPDQQVWELIRTSGNIGLVTSKLKGQKETT